jgi:hypothetical protein
LTRIDQSIKIPRVLNQEPREAPMPGRQSRRSVLATVAALPLTGALSACGSSDGASQSVSTSNDLAVGEIGRWAAGHGFAHPVRRERPAFLV